MHTLVEKILIPIPAGIPSQLQCVGGPQKEIFSHILFYEIRCLIRERKGSPTYRGVLYAMDNHNSNFSHTKVCFGNV